MLSTQSLRDRLDEYAVGRISADELEEWLAAVSWDMRRWSPIGVQRFVQGIQASFIDHSDGNIDSGELHRRLLERREQLRRSGDVTKEIEARRSILAQKIAQARQEHDESIAVSEAIDVTLEAASG